ncbi:MAG: glycosyltransferase family 9 protein [Candidatus Omnitrophica bacterium]|nr:glycosyltransferase family 9 protein [Candidatus Omnitrophota bacterium]
MVIPYNHKSLIPAVKKILVVQLAGIGDLVMATPTLRALRNLFPCAYIGLLVLSRSADLIKGLPYIDEVFALDIRFTDIMSLFYKGAFLRVFKVLKELNRHRFDMLINLEEISSFKGALKMALLFWFIGSKYKVGRDTDGRGFFFNIKVEEKTQDKLHAVEANLRVAKRLGAEIKDKGLEIPLSFKERKAIEDLLRDNNISPQELLIGLNPGAFRPSRRWPKEYWIGLAERIIEEYKGKVIIIGEIIKQKDLDRLKQEIKNNILIADKLSLKGLSALIERLNLFITNDSGPMHIAVAVNTALIAIFGPGDVDKFFPYTSPERYILLRKPVDCLRPCERFSCRDLKCLRVITPEDVMQAVKKMLNVRIH